VRSIRNESVPPVSRFRDSQFVIGLWSPLFVNVRVSFSYRRSRPDPRKSFDTMRTDFTLPASSESSATFWSG